MWNGQDLTQVNTICNGTSGARVLFVAPAIDVRDRALCLNRM
jgi:hypothetical protein